MPLQSQVINALPRRLLASLWASQETRLSLSQFSITDNSSHKQPSVTTQPFLCDELPIRYSHILRLLSTLSPETLQTPMIRHVAHRYLHDMCTLLHPSLRGTSPRAFSDLIRRLRHRQAASLIRMRYALPNAAALMENINTVGLGIQVLTDQHLSYSANDLTQRVQPLNVAHVAMQAIQDARQLSASCLGRDAPLISVRSQSNLTLTYMPHVLHRVLFESLLLAIRARMLQPQEKRWFHRPFSRQDPIRLDIFGGPTSVGFRLENPAPLLSSDLNMDVPRDPLGIPSCPTLLSHTEHGKLRDDIDILNLDWHVWSGWRSAKTLASHFGGHLDVMSVDGLGSTLYLALDRDTSLLERYPSKRTLNCSAYHLLHHHRRTSAAAAAATLAGSLTLAAAEDQLNAFLAAISDKTPTLPARKDEIYHSVSLSAAVAAAVGHA